MAQTKGKPKASRKTKRTSKKSEPKKPQAAVSAMVGELLDCTVENKILTDRMASLGFKSKNKGGMTYREAVICAQIINATKGDANSYKVLMGEKVADSTMPLAMMGSSVLDGYK